MFPELELTVENFNLFLLPWNAFSVYIHALPYTIRGLNLLVSL